MRRAQAQRAAAEELQHTELGDRRRGKRAEAMFATLLLRPAGRITQVFKRAREREAAYRFVESAAVRAQALVRAAAAACLLRAATLAVLIVPLDFTYLAFTDRRRSKGLGPAGSPNRPVRGLVAMEALGVSEAGVPQGLLDVRFHARAEKRRRHGACARCRRKHRRCPHRRRDTTRRLPLRRKETRFWLEAMRSVLERLRALRLRVRPWFQCDRGADFWQLLAFAAAHTQEAWVTVRSASDRRVDSNDGRVKHLRALLKRQDVLCTRVVQVPEADKRPSRTATLHVRACRVRLVLRTEKGRREGVEVGAVWAREASPLPRGARRLDWLLLTTRPLKKPQDAMAVVRAYELRWRVEDFNKTWKSVCGVQKSQLQSRAALEVWATLLAMAAARLQRLMHRSRSEPDVPAGDELSQAELLALHTVAVTPEVKRRLARATLTLGEAVEEIARLGGYTSSKSSRGPPGATTLGRGLQELAIATAVIEQLASEGKLELDAFPQRRNRDL
jgi:hypothetical protein